MSDPTDDDGRGAISRALEGHLDDPLVAAQWFRHAGGYENSGGVKRVLRRLGSSSDAHAADRLAAMNVLALTDRQFVAFTASTGWGGLKIKERIGEWPADTTTVRFDARTVTSSKFSQIGGTPYSDTSTWDIVRGTLRRHGDPRELTMDFPDHETTHELIAAVKARRRPSP